MSDIQLCYLTATEAVDRFAAGSLSPVELMEAVIARAEEVEPTINAFAETRFDEALAAARLAEKRYRDGTARALEGLPVAVKEEAPIAGQRNTLGCIALADSVATETAAFVERILDSGGIVHARTTTPATGSDIGGSIRIPASFCGVVGFKPPYGRVPETEIFNLDHYCQEGPLARTVGDCRLLENVIAGPDPSDVASLRPKLVLPEGYEPIDGMRIALSTDLGAYRVDPEVAANTAAAAERLRKAGAVVEEVTLAWDLATIDRAVRIHFGMIFGPSLAELYDTHADDLTSYARWLYEESLEISKADFVEGLKLEGELYRPLGQLLEQYDALVCPTTAVPALPAEYDVGQPYEVAGEPIADWLDVLMTLPFNIASRCPVMSVPSGRSAAGVPTGLSIVGPTYDDVAVFRIASAYEAVDPWLDSPDNRPSL